MLKIFYRTIKMETDLYLNDIKLYIERHKSDIKNIQHLTYASLARITGINSSKDWELLERVVDYAVACGLLSRHFEYLDDDDNSFVLDEENTELFVDTRGFVHPETGNIVCDRNNVVPFFTPIVNCG